MTDRRLRTNVRTAERRSAASTRWLERQLNDPYVHEAKRLGFRARSVFKLREIDQRHGLLRASIRVVDLGAAPGSWSQYAASRGCDVTAIDLLPVDPIPGVSILRGDFLDPEKQAELVRAAGGSVDLVLSDIAADATGQRSVDRLRAEAIGEAVIDYAGMVTCPGGNALIKLLKGSEARLLPLAGRSFESHRLIKPAATRKGSSELYLLCLRRRELAP